MGLERLIEFSTISDASTNGSSGANDDNFGLMHIAPKVFL